MDFIAVHMHIKMILLKAETLLIATVQTISLSDMFYFNKLHFVKLLQVILSKLWLIIQCPGTILQLNSVFTYPG